MRGIINDNLYQTPEGDIQPMVQALAESDESELVLPVGTAGRFIEGLFTTDEGDEYLIGEEFIDLTDDEDDDESPNEEEDADLPDEDDEEE